MRWIWGWVIASVAILVLGLTVMENFAGVALRVYSVKNVSAEVDRLGKEFTANSPDTPVVVTGGVPPAGFAAFGAGHQDILICPEGQLDATKILSAEDFKFDRASVGSYGMAIVVNPRLPVSQLTLDDVRKLFTGEFTNWNQLGGPKVPIEVYGREPNAGATIYMKSRLLHGAGMTPAVNVMPLDRIVLQEIAKSAGSVGYVRANRVEGANVKVIALKRDAGSPAVQPTQENVRNRSYPLTVTLDAHWNASSDKVPIIRAFIDLCRQKDLGLN